MSKDSEKRFAAHLEYLFHITCPECSFYWTYASMQKAFSIEKRAYTCPNCGFKGKVTLADEV
ncbi:MAG: hypothetical protein AAGG69_07090 [Pseudomonadota bacterium]